MQLWSNSSMENSDGQDHNFIIFLFLRGPKSTYISPQLVKVNLNYELFYLLK